jgi:phosphinothricin acetyltransferase
MRFSLRPAAEGDIPAISAIYREAVLYGTASFELEPPDVAEMLARYQAITQNGFPYIVAIDDTTNHLLGYAYAGTFRGRPAYRWTVENSVYVDEQARGRGVGTALTRNIIERCEATGFRQMIAVGFAHVGLLPATGYKHGRWLASVLMQRALGEGAASSPGDELNTDTRQTTGVNAQDRHK